MPTFADDQRTANRQQLWARSPQVFSLLTHPESAPDFPYPGMVHDFSDFGSVEHPELISEWIEETGWHLPPTPALALDCPQIPNGIFRLTQMDEQYDPSDRFQIYTVQSGRWQGRRVLKIYSEESSFRSNYNAYAFLNTDCSWTVWSRFANRSDWFLLATNALIEGITSAVGMQTDHCYYHDGELGIEYELAVESIRCRECNADLIDCYSLSFCDDHRRHGEDEEPVVHHAPVQTGERTIPLPMCEVTHAEVQ